MIARNPNIDRYQEPLKGVILDWAGTTVDYGSCAPALAFVAAFQQLDVNITIAEARKPMGRAKRDHISAILFDPGVAERWQKIHGRKPLEEDVDRLYDRFIPVQKATLKDCSQLIPGTVQAVQHCRDQGMKIGSSTGYTQELMHIVLPIAKEQGYEPDAVLCADDPLPAGRPAPWMCLENARRLEIYPMASIVKVDDTPVGIEAGRNAGMWTIGIAKSGNLVGLTLPEIEAMSPADLKPRLHQARETLFASGAHLVIDTIADLPEALTLIRK